MSTRKLPPDVSEFPPFSGGTMVFLLQSGVSIVVPGIIFLFLLEHRNNDENTTFDKESHKCLQIAKHFTNIRLRFPRSHPGFLYPPKTFKLILIALNGERENRLKVHTDPNDGWSQGLMTIKD
jgi:hypothetical protein